MNDATPPANRTLERIAAMLDAVDESPASASELARRTGLSISTAHRLALSMSEYDFLRRTDEGEYRLGRRFVRTALEAVALPSLSELRDATGETAQLWIRRGNERICQVSVDSQHELKATLPAGSRLTLPNGSSGRLLAHDPEAFESLGAHGWVESIARRTPGLGSVSAPVRLRGATIAALCLAMPLSRVVQTPGQDYGELVMQYADRIGCDFEEAKTF